MGKVLILSNFGMGLYKFRKELIQALVEQGYEVIVSLPDDEYISPLKELGCKYIESKLDRRGTNPIADLKLLFSYVKTINEVKPDIVLTYTIKPNVYGGIACRLTKTPYLPNVTGLGTAIENKGLMQKLTLGLYKFGLKSAKCVFFQNRSNQDYFIDNNILNTPSEVIPGSGVNLKQHQFEEYPIEDGITRFLYIGRIMKNKGIDELLAAAIHLKDKKVDAEIHIVGFCEENYSEKLKELNDSGVIHYHGQQDNIHNFIKNSHATILPSYHEGLSNVLLETASTGRPILASNVNGCKETFDEGVSGLEFEVRNVDALVETINKFLNLPCEMKQAMGLAGRKKMEQEFDRKIVVRSYLKKINALGDV